MSRRIFVNVRRGPMDNTAVCIFPWEADILNLIHQQEITEVSIETMATQKEGVTKVERQKLKKLKGLRAEYAPDLKEQLELMAYVDPENDPANDPQAEYERLSMKYGMDKELPIPCVTRVYGEFTSGGFTAKLKQHAEERAPMPQVLKRMLEEAAAEAEEEAAETLPARRARARKAA